MSFDNNKRLEKLEELLQERKTLYELQNFNYQTETITTLKQYHEIKDLPTDMQNKLSLLIAPVLDQTIDIIEKKIKQVCQEL